MTSHILEVMALQRLTLNQARAILRLRNTRITLGALAVDLDISTAAVTGLVDALEKRHILRRAPSLKDRRRLFAELTPTGVRLYHELQGLALEV